MAVFRISLRIMSPLSTPLQGDILFGHVCWSMVYTEGEGKLAEFLGMYDEGEPPLVFSNAFPEGHLPAPLLTPVYDEPGMNLELHAQLKRAGRLRYVPAQLFLSPAAPLSSRTIRQKAVQKSVTLSNLVVERSHNTIDRSTGTVREEGGLYTNRETWFAESGNYVDLYAASFFDKDHVRELLGRAIENGYGANASTGHGRIEVEDIIEVSLPSKGNRYMALGAFVPSKKTGLKNLRADIFTKYGKLGGHAVHEKNPFKKPVVMYAEGATFDAEDSRESVGMLLGGVHSDLSIRHHAFAPVIRFTEETA